MISFTSDFTSKLKGILRFSALFFSMTSLIVVSSCKKECDEPPVDNADPLDQMIALLDLQSLPPVSYPMNNPITPEKVELGRLLFWDPIVGGEKDMACVTCHHPGLGYGDGIDLAIGVNGTGLGPDRTENTGGLVLSMPIDRVPRNAPTIINSAYNGLTSSNGYDPLQSPMFWDSRFKSLETQCQKPPTSRSEMAGDAYAADDAMDSIALRLAAIPEYVQLFSDVFGGTDPVTVENYAKAVATFERAIISDNSPYDQYLAGDLNALSSDQKNGLILFNGKARCSNCHYGPMLSDYDFHTLGIPENPDSPHFPADSGAYKEFKFRTPTLRNVMITGPYMHNGMMETLQDVVEFMNAGVSQNPNITSDMMDNDITPLGLSEKEISQIVAFLESLTDEDFDKGVPTAVPSGLPVGGSIQ